MKKIFTVLLALMVVSRGVAQIPPAYYIDSQAVNFKNIYLDPNNIQSISVVKSPVGSLTTSGNIYLTLKQPFTAFLTLSDLISRQQLLPTKNILFIIDDKLIKDTTGVRIDPTFLTQVSVFNMSDVHYIGDEEKNMRMIIIRTKTKPTQPEEKGTIHLRGRNDVVQTKIPPENQGE